MTALSSPAPPGRGSAKAPAELSPGLRALRRARGSPRASCPPSRLGRALGAARVAGPEGTGRGGGVSGPRPGPATLRSRPGRREEEGGSARTARGAALLQAPVRVSGVGPGDQNRDRRVRSSTPTPAQPW